MFLITVEGGKYGAVGMTSKLMGDVCTEDDAAGEVDDDTAVVEIDDVNEEDIGAVGEEDKEAVAGPKTEGEADDDAMDDDNEKD